MATAAPSPTVLSSIDGLSADITTSGGLIQAHAARLSAGMTGGESFASGWARVSTAFRQRTSDIATTLGNLGITNSAVTSFVNGTDPASYSDISGILAGIASMRASYLSQ